MVVCALLGWALALGKRSPARQSSRAPLLDDGTVSRAAASTAHAFGAWVRPLAVRWAGPASVLPVTLAQCW